ncbi:sensor domain-containing phosphodiesterase [Marinobacter sp. M216]|uniref:Sensor domain-containing phosphodiesterase n=1 Tax=Marinobacter albus TaxID=3030833 RepID=A0ABT7HHW0_9GAMM|nr:MULTISPECIES: sensor domain-containing phosphodiesterase [unclassified Marinobacter]MBW7472555.1 sensor domain-containing phosphodiesterase [Marinobacter sp. F4218]MDK9559105.1 sensor domain-containing phosphodiesterase [Marinobacter sp. M216]
MRDSEILVTHHKALMELSHDADFIEQPRHQKLAALTELCARRLNVERVSVWSFPPKGDRINCEWLYDASAAPCDRSNSGGPLSLYQSEHPAYFTTIGSERVVAVENAQEDPRTRSFARNYLSIHNINAMLDAPVFDGARMSGVICLESRQNRLWSPPDISLAVAVADTVSLMNTHEAWIRSKQALDYVTRFDSLTGLANMDSLKARINHLIKKVKKRGRGALALIWIDIDRLKIINDGLGPQAGDQVIAEIGRRLNDLQLTGKDYLARIGGDEFAVVIRNKTLPALLDSAAELIQQRIRSPIRVDGQDLTITASLGISHYPGDCEGGEELLRSAEAAMYHTKYRGRGQSTQYDSEIQMTARSRFAVESELKLAMENGGLDVFYQPIMDSTGTRIESAEALVRWNHPDRGWLSPIEFLDVARSAGLMFRLGECVIERVCDDWRACRAKGINLATISVNLAPEQVMVTNLPSLIRDVCGSHSMPVSALQFEVTEDALQGELRVLSRVLEDLVDSGAMLAIDDFGTGYSSLARLKSLPFSRIKIDRSFIKHLPDDDNDRAITLSTIGLARGLGLSIVAEGVETQAHERWLFENHCDYLQGFRYSMPLPIGELTRRFYGTDRLVASQLRH